ncbi:polysaccharide deacetylase family protein [Streptomyces sp. SCL15-4]|uniref:polysaccharide deacetylase family protein n=1 Tax=Streptomyces sp. SCL15-4 TaxID=2967221 RepID=UPI002966EF4E|nr:polysaccharide deacetylase family protein [Streptomyces sp. SCL15-4]
MTRDGGPRTTGPGRRLRRHAVRGTLSALAAVVVATPFVGAWSYDGARRAVSPQSEPPVVETDGAGGGIVKARAGAPVVLAYHDINPDPTNDYTLTPRQLDAQLAALAAAGYRSLTTEEFTRYLTTGASPAPRTVYLTFDDGTRGLWAHADQVLARHRMHAASFLITGAVGTHRPYYLSWAEIDRMKSSGRWDFQDHTHLSHERAAVDAAGHQGSVLSNRLWLPKEKRLETENEYRLRVRGDLDESLRAFSGHHLPAPRLFAYPFSETAGPTNLAARNTSVLERLLRERFTASLTNVSSRPLPAGPRAAAARRVERLEVLRTMSTDAFVERLNERICRSPAEIPEPLRNPEQWQFPGSPSGTGLTALTGTGAAQGTYVSAVHLPLGTADWNTYRVTATVGRLSGTGTSASIEVGHGSLHPVSVTVSEAGLRVTERPAGGTARVTTGKLTPAARHRLTLEVSPGGVRVTVDGGHAVVARATEHPDPARTSGGVSLAVRDETAGTAAWPRFTALRIAP